VAFLLLVVLISAVGIAAVLVRHRQPTSIESSIAHFEEGLRAIAPEDQFGPVRATRNA